MINVIERLWVSASKGKTEKLLLNRDYLGRLQRVGGLEGGSGIILEQRLANYILRAKFISPVSLQPKS